MRIVIKSDRSISLLFLLDEAHDYVDLLTTEYDNFFSGAKIATEQQGDYLAVTITEPYDQFMARLEGHISLRYASLVKMIRRTLPAVIEEEIFQSAVSRGDTGAIFIYTDTHETTHTDKVRKTSEALMSSINGIMDTMEAQAIVNEGGTEGTTDYNLIMYSGGQQPFAMLSLMCRFGSWKWAIASIDSLGRRSSGIYCDIAERKTAILTLKKRIFYFHRTTTASSFFKDKEYPRITFTVQKFTHFVKPQLKAEEVKDVSEVLR